MVGARSGGRCRSAARCIRAERDLVYRRRVSLSARLGVVTKSR